MLLPNWKIKKLGYNQFLHEEVSFYLMFMSGSIAVNGALLGINLPTDLAEFPMPLPLDGSVPQDTACACIQHRMRLHHAPPTCMPLESLPLVSHYCTLFVTQMTKISLLQKWCQTICLTSRQCSDNKLKANIPCFHSLVKGKKTM